MTKKFKYEAQRIFCTILKEKQAQMKKYKMQVGFEKTEVLEKKP